jgi:hypothetical protein
LATDSIFVCSDENFVKTQFQCNPQRKGKEGREGREEKGLGTWENLCESGGEGTGEEGRKGGK